MQTPNRSVRLLVEEGRLRGTKFSRHETQSPDTHLPSSFFNHDFVYVIFSDENTSIMSHGYSDVAPGVGGRIRRYLLYCPVILVELNILAHRPQ